MARGAIFGWLSVVGLLASASASSQTADPLPRRGFFGVALDANDEGEVFVSAVHDGTAAACHGRCRSAYVRSCIAVYGTIATAPPPYPGRSERFFEEFAAVDVMAEWANLDVPVLLLHGEYDEVSTRDGLARIAQAVNRAHLGRAVHREFAQLDHCATRHATREASVGRCGAGEPTREADSAILAFLQASG
ncbi:MAG TPA: hypothetical protein VF339_18930 [Gammaproteobacteria bacterium]